MKQNNLLSIMKQKNYACIHWRRTNLQKLIFLQCRSKLLVYGGTAYESSLKAFERSNFMFYGIENAYLYCNNHSI